MELDSLEINAFRGSPYRTWEAAVPIIFNGIDERGASGDADYCKGGDEKLKHKKEVKWIGI
jgi:hypothetical protein